MAFWTVKTYHKKCVEQHEYFIQRDGEGRIKVIDGYRWAEFTVETSDDEFPEFEFTEVPGGDGKKDSLDLFSVSGNNIEGSELVSMDDGGCWGDIEVEGIEDEDEESALRDKINEEGSYSIEDDGDWFLDETECWVWGPIEVTNEDGSVSRIIIADAEGNVSDYEE